MSKNISKAHNPNPVGMSAIVTADAQKRSGNMNPNFDIDLLEDLTGDLMLFVENGILCQNGKKWSRCPHKEKGKLEDDLLLHVAYDQNAKAKYFVRFLKVLCQDDENDEGWRRKAWLILEAIGYSLLPSCKSRKLFLLSGYQNMVEAVLKVIHKLIGRKLEPLVGPTPLKIRRKRLETKCFVVSTHPPIGRKESKDFFRKLIIIPLKNEKRKREVDEYLDKQLEAELPGILNLILRALSRLKKRGKFNKVESGQKIKKKWQSETWQLSSFIEDCCYWNRGDNDERFYIRSGNETNSKEIYDAYLRWAERTKTPPLEKWTLIYRLRVNYGLADRRTREELLPERAYYWLNLKA